MLIDTTVYANLESTYPTSPNETVLRSFKSIKVPGNYKLVIIDKDKAYENNPVLAGIGYFQTMQYVLAVVTEEKVQELAKEKFLLEVFPGDPQEHVWYLTLIPSKKLYDPCMGEPAFQDGTIFLFHFDKQTPVVDECLRTDPFGERVLPFLFPPQNEDNNGYNKDPILTALTADISTDNWFTWVQELSGEIPISIPNIDYKIISRHTDHPDNAVVTHYLLNAFRDMGYETFLQPFEYNNELRYNIIATMFGTDPFSGLYLMGGHFDSRAEDLQNILMKAPGAEDNASGVALILEIARLFSKHQFTSGVQFVLFNAEEQHMLGSRAYVNFIQEQGIPIRSAIIMDMVGFYDANYGIVVEGRPEYLSLMRDVYYNVKRYTPLRTSFHFFSYGSDHVSFQKAGIPSVLLIDMDWDNYPEYHTQDDTIDLVSQEFAGHITKLSATLLASLLKIVY